MLPDRQRARLQLKGEAQELFLLLRLRDLAGLGGRLGGIGRGRVEGLEVGYSGARRVLFAYRGPARLKVMVRVAWSIGFVNSVQFLEAIGSWGVASHLSVERLVVKVVGVGESGLDQGLLHGSVL